MENANTQSNKLIKAYETKILDLTKELENSKVNNDKIKTDHLAISRAF